jgi:hypothetical protein
MSARPLTPEDCDVVAIAWAEDADLLARIKATAVELSRVHALARIDIEAAEALQAIAEKRTAEVRRAARALDEIRRREIRQLESAGAELIGKARAYLDAQDRDRAAWAKFRKTAKETDLADARATEAAAKTARRALLAVLGPPPEGEGHE